MSEPDHEALIDRFYTAFAAGDAEAMVACYAPDVTFSDPVFTDLRGADAGDMWRMLTSIATDLKIAHSAVRATGGVGHAHWEAWYPFSATGRRVHNVIEASFTFRDGRIATHRDAFDLWGWTRMALGPTGWFLGWTPMVQGRVRDQAMKGLRKWQSRRGTPGA